jgi:hypothetical protein
MIMVMNYDYSYEHIKRTCLTQQQIIAKKNLTSLVWNRRKEYHLSHSSIDVEKGDRKTALTSKTACGKTAIGLPPVTSVLFLTSE